MRKITKRHAYFKSKLETRAEGENEKYIEGYFAVFGQETELWNGCFEKIAPSAFEKSLKSNDIRCLFNHDSGFVLGRTASRTLELRTDSHGLWGRVQVNQNDMQAMDIYARVQRGDISGCSFGFEIVSEEFEDRGQSFLYTETECDLHEVSICTFPAYPQTEIQARKQDFNKIQKRAAQQRKEQLKKKLDGIIQK